MNQLGYTSRLGPGIASIIPAVRPPSRTLGLHTQVNSHDDDRKALDGLNSGSGIRDVESGIEARTPSISDQAILEEVRTILKSPTFVHSERLSRFLRYAVEHALRRDGQLLKEYEIGTQVYDRGVTYHPEQDSIVRTEARRLRRKLKEYYQERGRNDAIFIYFRTGGYTPVFHRNDGLGIVPAPDREPILSQLPRHERASISMRPFVDLSRDPVSEACAFGITDELVHRLIKTERLRVFCACGSTQGSVVPGSSFQNSTQESDFLFEGTVRRGANRIRVTSRIHRANGLQVWSDRLETEINHGELFEVLEEIACTIVRRLSFKDVFAPAPCLERRTPASL